jgi:HK97 family phage major capsid protein
MLVKLTKPFMGQEAGKVIDVTDGEGQAIIEKGFAEKAGDDVLSPVVTRAMEAAMNGVSKSIDTIVDATLKRFLDAQASAKKLAVPAIFGAGSDGNPHHSFGDWLHHAIKAISGKGRDMVEAADYLEKNYKDASMRRKAAMAEYSGTIGGYTVPVEFASEIQKLMAEDTFFRQRAFVQPMTSATIQIPYLDITTAQSAGVSAFFGGMQAAWTAEAATRSEYAPTFRQLELKAHELSATSVASNVLLQDSAIGLEKFLMVLFAKVIGWTEEYAFLQGSGVGKPLGVLNSPCLITTTRVGNSGGAGIGYGDVSNLLGRILPSSLARAIWVAHPYVLADLVQLRDASGRVVWVDAMGGATEKVPGYLFGRPVYISEKVPGRSLTGDFSLIDPSLYVIGDRLDLEVAASEHVNFVKNQMTWRIIERVDGQPWLSGPVTLADGSSTVSPFVTVHS